MTRRPGSALITLAWCRVVETRAADVPGLLIASAVGHCFEQVDEALSFRFALPAPVAVAAGHYVLGWQAEHTDLCSRAFELAEPARINLVLVRRSGVVELIYDPASPGARVRKKGAKWR